MLRHPPHPIQHGNGRHYRLAPNQVLQLENPEVVRIYASAGSAEFEVVDPNIEAPNTWTENAELVEGISQGWESFGAARIAGPIKAGPDGAVLQVLYPGDEEGLDQYGYASSRREWERRGRLSPQEKEEEDGA